jgi:RNA polymerase sigma factor (sigma-70 family)
MIALPVSYEIVAVHEIGQWTDLPLDTPPSPQQEDEATMDLLGYYLREIDRSPLLSERQERHLVARLAQGDRVARERLIEANLRLVVHIAKRYQGPDGFGTPLLDLIGYGNTGLVRAVNKYNSAFGVRFGTYATYHIKAAILRALDEHGRLIRRSSYQIEQHRRLHTLADDLTHQMGRLPTFSDLALHTGQSERSLELIQTVDHLPLSLDAPLSPVNDDLALHETLASQQAPDPAEALCEQERVQDMQDAVTTLLTALTQREQEVITCLFGLDGKGEREALAASSELGMCRSRVYQVFHAAMRKLRHAASANGITCRVFDLCA